MPDTCFCSIHGWQGGGVNKIGRCSLYVDMNIFQNLSTDFLTAIDVADHTLLPHILGFLAFSTPYLTDFPQRDCLLGQEKRGDCASALSNVSKVTQ